MAVATLEAFLDLVRKSGLVESERLDGALQELRATGQHNSEPAQLAEYLVQRGMLTAFQAEQLLAGRWKGFFISKYKILQRLGSGGMGMVFLAEHKYMKRLVALKVLPRSRTGESSALERFYREAKAIAALDHPNVVRAYDLDQEGDLHFLVMEYVDGFSLQELVKGHGSFDVTRAAHYLYQAAKGLQHAFSVGLIHRDIKPANLLVSRAGLVKLLDLGLARFFLDDQDALTRKYDEKVLGTADYLAPEQAVDSHVVDIRADIYSLGATFYYVLAGHPPFPEGTVAQKLIWHQTKMPRPIRELRPDVPELFADLLQRMLAKKPQDRPQTPEEVARTLEPLVDLRVLIPPPGVEAAPGAGMGPASTDQLLATLAAGSSSSWPRVSSKVADSSSAVLSTSTEPSSKSRSGSPLVDSPRPASKSSESISKLESGTSLSAKSPSTMRTPGFRPVKPPDEKKSAASVRPFGEWVKSRAAFWLVVSLGLVCGAALAWSLLRWLGQ